MNVCVSTGGCHLDMKGHSTLNGLVTLRVTQAPPHVDKSI